MPQRKEIELDVRPMPPWERHPKIFELFDGLKGGQAIRLVNDHDPRPLHYQFMMERPQQFEWQSWEEEPRKWVALIRKVKKPEKTS